MTGRRNLRRWFAFCQTAEAFRYPRFGQPAQDITGWLEPGQDSDLRLQIAGDAVQRSGSAIVGRQPGGATLQAICGETQGDPVSVRVVPLPPDDGPVGIRVEPSRVVLPVGEATAQFQVLVRRAGDTVYRAVTAEVASADERILAPLKGQPNRFTAMAPGATRVQASIGGQSGWASVAVVGDWFQSVREVGQKQHDATTFYVELEVRGSSSDVPLEYRAIRAGESPRGGWTTATPDDDGVRVRLVSAPLTFQLGSFYQLVVEARRQGSEAVHRYPLSGRLQLKLGKTPDP